MAAEAKRLGQDFDLIQAEWKSLISELVMFVSDVRKLDMGKPDTVMGMGHGGSAHGPFPSTVYSSELDSGDDHSKNLLPAFAVALGKENIPESGNASRGKMVNFGAAGDYKNSVAFRRALPAIIARKPLTFSEGESLMSGESGRQASEPTWNFPSYGVVLDQDSDILSKQSTKKRIEMWLVHMQREFDKHPVINEPPPISKSDDEDMADWEDLDEPSKENFMVTPTPSEVALGTTVPRNDGEISHSGQRLSGQTAAEYADIDGSHFFEASYGDPRPDKPRAAMLSTSNRPLFDAIPDSGRGNIGSETGPNMVRLPSSRYSVSDAATNTGEERGLPAKPLATCDNPLHDGTKPRHHIGWPPVSAEFETHQVWIEPP
ncbi:hypothetical protein BR93DRAFT_969159 [Coniochaeta sp. PMI_546]|nr:hypothetical protein BR93DRAFT_969159 [Coniochaeta sp. PMI_546]